MKRSIANIQTETTEEEDYCPKLKLCKFNHLSSSATSKDEESSCNTIVILDDSISSELLLVKYSSETLIISFLSNFETLLSTYETNQLLNDQTLSNSLKRITNMYCTPPDNDFSFLSNITEPGVILYWIENVSNINQQRRNILAKALPYLSSSVKQNEQVILKLLENHCDLIELDFEKFDDSLIINIRRVYRSWRGLEKMCEKLTVDQTLLLIESTTTFDFPFGNKIIACLPGRIVNDLKFWRKCKASYRAEVFKENFGKITNEIKNNKDLILPWLKSQQYDVFINRDDVYKNLSTELQKDIDICCQIVNGCIPDWLNEEMKTNRDFLLKAVQSKHLNYYTLPKEFQHDKEFLLAVLKYYPYPFLLYNNHGVDFLIQAIEINDGHLFKHLSRSIRNDKEFVMKLLKESNWCSRWKPILEYLGQELRNDKEFMLYLMGVDELNYKYASKGLRNDPELYNHVITPEYYSMLYGFLPDHLKSDFNMIWRNILTFKYQNENIPENIRNNKEMMMELLQLGNGIYNYASNELKCDREFVMKAFQYDREIEIDLNYWKDDLDVLLNIPNLNLAKTSEEQRSNFNIALAAVLNNRENLKFVSKNLWNDCDFVVNVFKRSCGERNHIIWFLPTTILENKGCIRQIAKYLPKSVAFEHVDRSDFEFMLSFIEQLNPIHFASEELRKNKLFVEKVLEKYPISFHNLSNELKDDSDFILYLVRKQHPTKLQFWNLFLHCTPKVVFTIINNFPHLFPYISSDFKEKKEHQQRFYEMSFLNLEVFKQCLINYPKNLPKHQQLLKCHLRLKIDEKFNNSNLPLKIWNQCSSLLTQDEDVDVSNL